MHLLIDRSTPSMVTGTTPTFSLSVLKDEKDAEIFHRNMIKLGVQSGDMSKRAMPVARLNGVYLYMLEEGRMVMTTDSELRL